jgi:Domain of unknown function (DUF4926)
MIEKYSRVCLLSDKYFDEGVGAGALGYVIEIHHDGALEVEFSDEDGITIAQLVLNESELQVA